MKRSNRWLVLVLIVAALQLSACAKKSSTYSKIEPAKIEKIAGTEFSRVTMTPRAVQRLGIETAPVRELPVAPQPSSTAKAPGNIVAVKGSPTVVVRKVIPYSALLYDQQGGTWVYTSPEARVFVRHKVIVENIEGAQATLLEGPPAGTQVVSVGAAEVYGTELKVGH